MIGDVWGRLVHGSRHLWEHPDWADVAGASWADRIMDVAVTDRFHAKQGRSIGRWVLSAGKRELTVFLKRHYELPRFLGLLAALCPWHLWSPGAREWKYLCWAADQGVAVPRPLAAGEFVGPWGRLQSFVAVEELCGMLPLHEAIPLAAKRLAANAFAAWKRGLIAEMVRLVRLLHDGNRFHRDLYLCHFYVAAADIERTPHEWQRRVYLIDFHRLSRRRATAFFGRVKDLAQLLYSAGVDGVTAGDCRRFWRGYCAGRARPWLRRAVLWKGRRYTGHNRKRRSVFTDVSFPRTALEHRPLL